MESLRLHDLERKEAVQLDRERLKNIKKEGNNRYMDKIYGEIDETFNNQIDNKYNEFMEEHMRELTIHDLELLQKFVESIKEN